MTRDEAIERARRSPMVWEPWITSATGYRYALADLLLAVEAEAEARVAKEANETIAKAVRLARRVALEEAIAACEYVSCDDRAVWGTACGVLAIRQALDALAKVAP